jgi:hypothetical protein
MNISQSGWSGTWEIFLNTPKESFMEELKKFYSSLPWTTELSKSQEFAWSKEYDVMQLTIAEVIAHSGINPELCWLAFEQELVGEGGKRSADVNIVLPTGHLFVVEFKHKDKASEDEVKRALFDLQTMLNFHSESHELEGHCFLALTKEGAQPFEDSSVICDISKDGLLFKLADAICTAIKSPFSYDVLEWKKGVFNRQPSIIHGTVKVFFDNEIPSLKTEVGDNILDARQNITKLYQYAKDNQQRYLVVVNGRPGAGKTLLGISSVADVVNLHGAKDSKPIFLSGNEVLVDVLQHTLDYYGKNTNKKAQIDSRSIIQHLVYFKRSIKNTVREENFVVFDEAQRAWETLGKGSDESDLDLFCHWLAQKDYGVLVLLVGDGQAIHRNEMSLDNMMKSLGKAVLPYRDKITPIMPSLHAHLVSDIQPKIRENLFLSTPIRQNYTQRLDDWIEAVLNNNKTEAYEVAQEIRLIYPLLITVDKKIADQYAKTLQSTLHEGNIKSDAFRVGWLKSSKSKKMSMSNYGEENGNLLELDRKLNLEGSWYVDPPNSPNSCCQLKTACTEFSSQGLELSLALFEWGPDLLYRGNTLQLSENKAFRRNLDDYTFGSYRVLLSRGRTGLVVKCNDSLTYQYLVECGMEELSTK